MKRIAIVAAALFLLPACKHGNKTPLINKKTTGVEADDNKEPAGPVLARLSGYPEGSSSEYNVTINVDDVDEFQYKWGLSSEVLCSSPAAYSEFKSASEGIAIDLSELSENTGPINVCVLGKRDGEIQAISSQAGWLWDAEIPGGPSNIELLDGDNKITGKIMSNSGTMLLAVRSEGSTTWTPEPGKEYKVGDRFGDALIVAANTAEFVDENVENEETWTYTIFAMNAAKRYSSPVTEEITLAKPDVAWIAKADLKDNHIPVQPINNRWVCRVNGQAGRLFSMNNDIKDGVCGYAFGTQVLLSDNYDVLVGTKGNPMDILRLADVTLDEQGRLVTVVGEQQKLISGTENVNDDIYVCISYTNANKNQVLSFGKMGAHITNGCNQYVVQGNQRVFNQSINLRMLIRR